MKTLQSGSYHRLASLDALWWAWRDCRRGKRYNPTIARFEIDCDRHLWALQRELLDYRYRPSPWRLHLDIHAYFLSMGHTQLLALFGQRIVDADTLALLRLIIESGNHVYGSQLAATTSGERCPPAGQGLPLGLWFSQWCGNFYLDILDHFVKWTLKYPVTSSTWTTLCYLPMTRRS